MSRDQFQEELNELADEYEVRTELDAVALRASIDFDPEAARQIASVVHRAAEIVEEARSEKRDKPSPFSSSQMRAHQLMLIRHSEEPHSVEAYNAYTLLSKRYRDLLSEEPEPQGGLGRHIISALADERNVPTEAPIDERDDGSQVASEELSDARVFLVGGIPVATTAIGTGLLIESALRGPIVPNPYLGLFIFLAGLALIATAITVLRERQSH